MIGGVCTFAPLAFIQLLPCYYTHIWLILWVVIWRLIIKAIIWVKFSLRRVQEPYALLSLKHFLTFYCCCLQFFWTHPETMQCFVVDTRSTFFLEAWLVFRVFRNIDGVKIHWCDFYTNVMRDFYCPFIFGAHIVWCAHHPQIHACLFPATISHLNNASFCHDNIEPSCCLCFLQDNQLCCVIIRYDYPLRRYSNALIYIHISPLL